MRLALITVRMTHCDGLAWHVVNAVERARSIGTSEVVEGDDARTRIAVRARLIKADVPRTTDAQQLEIEPATVLNLLVVAQAVGLDILTCYGSVRDVDVFLRDIDVIEEVFVHKVPITLQVLLLHWVVLV